MVTSAVNVTARLALLPVVLIGGMTAFASELPQPQDVSTLRRWANAVIDHLPGHADEAVRQVTGMTYRARVELNASYPLFIAALAENFVVTRSEADDEVTTFGRAVRDRVGTAPFLKRAAMLHADALIFSNRFPTPPDDAPPPPRPDRDGRREPVPPLLHNERVTITRDGEVLGDAKADWNLPFARSLLDVLLSNGRGRVAREDGDFVVAWYHAVSAYLFANGNFADSTPHLRQAARVLPDEPHVLFDRATYAETLGLPAYQTVRDDPMYGNRQYLHSGVPPARQTNEDAERLYRRALAVDHSYVEARVRLARLLEERGQHEQAAEQITTALDSRPSGVALLYTHLIAGRIATSRGRHEDALRHYRAASTLDPNAQSALIGASHAALMLADVREALSPLQRLDHRAGGHDNDPWLDYELGAGRDVDALLAALRSRLAK